MSCGEITLKWSKKMYSINELHEFFCPGSYDKNSAYIYFWIYSDNNIRYIGESNQLENRFQEHMKNMIHGNYAVVNDTDMKGFHENWNNEKCNKDRSIVTMNNGRVSYFNDKYFFDFKTNKEIDFEELEESIESIISTAINNIKELKFIFAEISTEWNKVTSKECEALFMLALRENYNNPPAMTRANDLYFGHISKYPAEGIYKIHNNFSSGDGNVKKCLAGCGLDKMVHKNVKIVIEKIDDEHNIQIEQI